MQARVHSDAAKAQKHIATRKKKVWQETGSWPWKIFHESERAYWLPGTASTGRGWSGPRSQNIKAQTPQYA